MLYSHNQNDINHSCNTIHIQMQADSIVSDTNGFINSWLRSMATRREWYNSYYANPIPNGRCILWCLRSLSVEIWKPNYIFNGPNSTLASMVETQLSFSMIQSQLLFFKILKFSGPSLPGMTSSTLQPHFLSGGLLWQWWLSYPLRASIKLHQLLCAWTLNPNSSKHNQTEW